MDIEIRPCGSVEEVKQAITPIGYYFGRSDEDQAERLIRVMPAERVYAAWEGGRAVGGLGAFPFQLTIPGGRVPAAGVTVAGVLPTHRRRGVLRGMMRALLDACYQHGEPVAYLWASEDTIYGRFGFGWASFAAEIDLPRERSASHAPFAPFGRVQLVSPGAAEEFVAPVYERVAVETPGMFARSSTWWQARILADPEWRRGTNGDLQCAVLENEGRPTAYALYRINSAFERGLQTGSVAVIEAIARVARGDARYLAIFVGHRLDGPGESLAPAARSSAPSLAGGAAPARFQPSGWRLGAPTRFQDCDVSALVSGSRFRGHRCDR